MKSLRSTLSASPVNPFESEEQNKGKKGGVGEGGEQKKKKEGGIGGGDGGLRM